MVQLIRARSRQRYAGKFQPDRRQPRTSLTCTWSPHLLGPHRESPQLPIDYCNLASLRRLREMGLWWDMSPGNNALRTRFGSKVCDLVDRHDQYVLEHIPATSRSARLAFPVHRSGQTKTSRTTPQKWHLRLGHAGPDPLSRLVNAAEGVRIRGPSTVECDACAQGKMTRQVSRAPRPYDEGPGIRIAVDLAHMYPNEEGYDSMMILMDRWSGYI